jgi:hypothetical protein
MFKVHDTVAWARVRGKVIEVNDKSPFGVKVLFDGVSTRSFTEDGRLETWHKEVSLKKLEHPKQVIIKTMIKYVVIYNSPIETLYYFDSWQLANDFHQKILNSIGPIQLSGRYEI